MRSAQLFGGAVLSYNNDNAATAGHKLGHHITLQPRNHIQLDDSVACLAQARDLLWRGMGGDR